MFEKYLIKIWDKIEKEISLKWNDWIVLYLNDQGFTGAGYIVLLGWFLFQRAVEGNDGTFLGITNWTYVVVFAVLSIHKNLMTLEKLYKKYWNKLFPKGIVIPYIERKIK